MHSLPNLTADERGPFVEQIGRKLLDALRVTRPDRIPAERASWILNWVDQLVHALTREVVPRRRSLMIRDRKPSATEGVLVEHARRLTRALDGAYRRRPFDAPADVLLDAAERDALAGLLSCLTSTFPVASSVDDPPRRPAHSPEFTSVTWGPTTFHFTKMQASVVKALWKAEGQTLTQENLGVAAGSSSERFKLRSIFRSKGVPHPAIDSMIVEARKGTWHIPLHP